MTQHKGQLGERSSNRGAVAAETFLTRIAFQSGNAVPVFVFSASAQAKTSSKHIDASAFLKSLNTRQNHLTGPKKYRIIGATGVLLNPRADANLLHSMETTTQRAPDVTALKAPLLLADNYDVSMFQIGAVNALVGATSTTRQRGWFSTERQLPAPRRIVLYQTDTGQRLGYMDEHQQWRRLNGQTESEKVISWIVAATRPAR